MPDFGIFRGFNDKLFGNKLYAGQLPVNLGKIGSESFGFTGLLDDYPNAAAAYSLRLLRRNYNGSAIRVRRSSNNDEQDIGFTATGNLDTTALTTFCGAGNGFVTTWYDQSGNGRNATQTTAANQPQIVSIGSVINLNAKPTIQFNNNQFLGRTSFNLTEISTFTVINKYTMSNYGGYFRNVTSTGTSFGIFSKSPSAWISQMVKFSNGSDTSPYVARGTIKSLPTNQYLENWIFNNTNQQIYENNSSISTETGASNWVGNSNFTLGSIDYSGAATSSKNEIQEFIIYDLNQSSNRTGISTNINTYYGIY